LPETGYRAKLGICLAERTSQKSLASGISSSGLSGRGILGNPCVKRNNGEASAVVATVVLKQSRQQNYTQLMDAMTMSLL